jgi:hypothetical protein
MNVMHPALGEETIPPDEPENIQQLIAIHQTIQELTDRKRSPSPRNLHPKQHGCVRAELIIEGGVPERLRQGIFREPRSYPALVRFSNSIQRDDRLPDAHGMAIKVFDVAGEKLLEHERQAETQDLILIDHPVFFARDVAEMVPLMHEYRRLRTGGPLEKSRTVLKAMLSRDQPYRILRQTISKRPHSPLDIQYWSTTPYKLDARAIKFSLRPHFDSLPVHCAFSADQLRRALSAQLKEHEARFDFLIQEQTDPVAMPIEDATSPWDEERSPYRQVAWLRIPPQQFETPEKLRFGETLSFTPWHALPNHRPLGGINRARKELYEIMSARRHEWNQQPHREPTLAEMDSVF